MRGLSKTIFIEKEVLKIEKLKEAIQQIRVNIVDKVETFSDRAKGVSDIKKLSNGSKTFVVSSKALDIRDISPCHYDLES